MATVTRKGGIGIKELKSRVEELNRLKAFVGWLESAKYDDGTPVAGVAAVHEYGSTIQGIPPRPFLRTATEDNQETWKKIIEKGAKDILNGNSSANDVMELLGLKITGDIKTAIKGVTTPALKQSTVDAKRRKKADGKAIGNLTKPLIEEAIMINTVTHEVQS